MSTAPQTPEVVFLRPVGDLPPGYAKVMAAWPCAMVEMGILFAFDDNEDLPDVLPDDLRGVKLVLIDRRSWDAHHRGAAGRALAAYKRNGGTVFCVDAPDTWSVTDETVVRNPLEMMAASAGLTLNHPALRQRLQSRTFARIYETRRDHFIAQVEGVRRRPMGQIFTETLAFHILQTLEWLHDYDPAGGWDRRLTGLLDYLVTCDEPVINLDNVVGMETFIRWSQRTGNPRYLDFARCRLAVVMDSFDRLDGAPVLQPKRDHLIWVECAALAAPGLALLGAVDGDTRYVDLAVRTAHVVQKMCFDPARRLYYHGGRPGYHTPVFWARGQGWAVIGLAGLLRHLPRNHPEWETVRHYMGDALEGLLECQDDEGLWHNVVDSPLSRPCIRAACIITYAYAEARRMGWLADRRLDEMLRRSWRAIRGRVWRNQAASTVWATGASATYQFYFSSPHVFYGLNDVFHAGAVMRGAFEGE